MSLEFGYFNKNTKEYKSIKYRPAIYCDLYVNQGKKCPMVEKVKSTGGDKIILQGDFVRDICMNACIHFIKRDVAQLLTSAGL